MKLSELMAPAVSFQFHLLIGGLDTNSYVQLFCTAWENMATGMEL